MFEPIQRYLPKYFNTDPERREAVRLRAPAGTAVAWEISDEQLRLSWGEQQRTYELADYTVGALVDALQAEGFTLDPGYDQWLLALGAVVLLEGRGTLTDRSGTPWYAFTSLVHAITRPVEREWRRFSAAIPEAVAQESLATADESWLDVHGDLYGIPRLPGMDDAAYRAHVRAEVFRPRNNPRGMEHNLRRLGYPNVRVTEPWQSMHYLSTDAALSGEHHLPGAPIYEYHTLRLTTQGHQAWAGPMAQAEADRPAGTILLPPATVLPPFYLGEALNDLEVQVINTFCYAAILPINRMGMLSVDLGLSVITPSATLPIAPIEVRALVTLGLRPPISTDIWTGLWDDRTWIPSTAADYEMTPGVTIPVE